MVVGIPFIRQVRFHLLYLADATQDGGIVFHRPPVMGTCVIQGWIAPPKTIVTPVVVSQGVAVVNRSKDSLKVDSVVHNIHHRYDFGVDGVEIEARSVAVPVVETG